MQLVRERRISPLSEMGTEVLDEFPVRMKFRSIENVLGQVMDNQDTSIDELDLSMIKMKLCLPIEDEGKGWSLDRANRCERLYKMFLKLNILYPEVSVVPTKEIDDMWHANILDTRKYHADCQKVFGFYFHHFPYFGLRGEEDKASLSHAFDITKSLFTQHFGEDLTRAEGEATCGNRNCNGCRNRGV